MEKTEADKAQSDFGLQNVFYRVKEISTGMRIVIERVTDTGYARVWSGCVCELDEIKDPVPRSMAESLLRGQILELVCGEWRATLVDMLANPGWG